MFDVFRSRATSTDGDIRLRPRSAAILSVIVWAVCALLSVQAVLAAGWQGVAALPLPLLVSVGVWMLLWSPRVLVRRDGIDLRNVLHSYWFPFDAIEDVRVGPMVRIIARGPDREPMSVAAWNAPGGAKIGSGRPTGGYVTGSVADQRTRELTRSLTDTKPKVSSRFTAAPRSDSDVLREKWVQNANENPDPSIHAEKRLRGGAITALLVALAVTAVRVVV